MNFNMSTLTQNQKLVLFGILGIVVSAFSTTATAVVQQYTLNGLDIPVLVNVAVITFMPLLGTGLYNFIPGHALQIMQALQDAKQQAQQQHAVLAQTVQTLAAAQIAQPPSQPAPVAPQPVQQVPFPPQAVPVFTPPPAVARSFGDTSSMPTVAQ